MNKKRQPIKPIFSEEKIFFYKQDEIPYGCFSNFYKNHPIIIDGIKWTTVEHFYQAMKFQDNLEVIEKIRATKWAGHAWKIGNDPEVKLDKKWWLQVRDEIMMKALRAKFTQHENLKQILLDSKNAEIIEHTANDSYWADGGDGTGKNMLGKMLMMIRNELNNEECLISSVRELNE